MIHLVGSPLKIVLLPGLDGTGNLFDPLVAVTPTEWETQVVRYPRDEVLDYPAYGGFVRGLLPSREDYLLLGESFSGPIAISLAAEHPPNLRGLVLCNTFAKNPWWKGFSWLPWASIFSRPIPYLVQRRLGAKRENLRLRKLLRSSVGSVHPHVLARRLRAVLSVDVTEELIAYRGPMLYLRSSLDTTVRERSLAYIRGQRPELEVAEFPVRHLLLQLLPDEAWAALNDFTQKIPESREA